MNILIYINILHVGDIGSQNKIKCMWVKTTLKYLTSSSTLLFILGAQGHRHIDL